MIVGLECPSCGDWIPLEDLGLDKPVHEKLKTMPAFQRFECDECGEQHPTEDEANECCEE